MLRSGSVEVKLKSTESTQKPVLSGQKSGKPEKGKNPPLAEVKEEAKEEKKGGQVRGKKGKNKKIKEKYKDQDEEEREMRMKILQVFSQILIFFYEFDINNVSNVFLKKAHDLKMLKL